MSYLLDTCILSKMRRLKKNPDKKLEDWLIKSVNQTFYISSLTVGEFQQGISKLEENKSNNKLILEDWLKEELLPRFNKHVLSFDTKVALTWGKMVGNLAQKGINLPTIDSMIAATALTHQLCLVTENIKDFQQTEVQLFSPWI